MVHLIFAGDLQAQCTASAYTMRALDVPFAGLYGACSTMAESLGMAACFCAAGLAGKAMALTSSHFCTAERQFRFPLEYANQRPVSATWTVTGGAAFILARAGKEPLAKIAGITTGKIVDFGIKDSMNMGAVMAPAACEVIAQHLAADTLKKFFDDTRSSPDDYDLIVTGDLGSIGQEILFDLLDKKGYDIRSVHEDCGMLIYDSETQGTGSGGSGCGCAASTLSAHFLPKLATGELKRIL